MLRLVQPEAVQVEHVLVPHGAGPLADKPDVQPPGEERHDADHGEVGDPEPAERAVAHPQRDQDDERDRRADDQDGPGPFERISEVAGELLTAATDA